jgi:uncharacterized protein (TIGR03437 family)
VLAATAAVLALGAPAEAYYHYIHYFTRTAPFTPVPQAYDLNALPNKTVTFFVSDAGPATYGGNDTFGSVLSQIKQAAVAWNAVPNSDLRVAFGGLESASQVASSKTPAADVTFQDLPGLLGMGGVTVAQNATVQSGQNGPFVPILRGVVILTNNTADQPGPSYQEGYYTTAVHEFGHALGLQHTWTGSAMSQDVIRNTSRARPVDADDIAAILELYGKAGWNAAYGSISGTVTQNGGPVNMASVVAIPPNGPAVSALTNPDGTYTINGLPPNQYLLYAHPLPPDAIPSNGSGLSLPLDATGRPLAGPSGYFQTSFFPAGTLDPAQATTFTIAAGTNLTGQNFAVQSRSSVPLYDAITYSFLDTRTNTYTYSQPSLSITPAFVDVTNPQKVLTIVAETPSGSVMAIPQSVKILGGAFDNATVQPWGTTLAIYFYVPSAPLPAGPRHLVFNFGNDLYVLPDGVNLVQKGPPLIAAVASNPDGTVTVTGTNFGPDSRVFFDGLQAAQTASASGAITVTPPVGASGQNAAVTVFASDGQNSTFYATPPVYVYGAATPQIGPLNLTSLPAGSGSSGTPAMVDITGVNTSFVDGQVTVGLGTGDATVRRVWVRGPTHLIADVVVSPNAAPGSYELSVISGFQAMSQPFGFQVQAPNPDLPQIDAVVNGSYQQVFYPGSGVVLFGSNLAASSASAQIALNGVPLTQLFTSPSQINVAIPQGFPTGPALLTLNSGSASAFPLEIQIDVPAPQIQGVTGASGAVLGVSATGDPGAAANPGDVLTALVGGIDPAAANPSRLQVTVSGVPMSILQVTPQTGLIQIQFVLSQSFGGSQAPVVVSADGSASAPFSIVAR